MGAELYLYIAASVCSAFSNWSSWHFVWRHEGGNVETKTFNESIFWILFSYILPFLPTLFYALGEGGSGYLGPMMSAWSTGILSAMLGFLMLGQAMSSWSWKEKTQSDSLPDQIMKHFSWTTALTAISGVLWIAALSLILL